MAVENRVDGGNAERNLEFTFEDYVSLNVN